MQWEIHVLGDAAWVHFVINAVSSITGYGTLGAIGAMLGLLAMTFSGITSKGGPQLDVAWFAVAFVVFYAFFIPRADRVLITEVNPPSHLVQGRVYVVDNVPMGLAVVGTVVTKLGLALAQEYDTTFGSAEDTERVLTGAVGANIRRIADLRMMQDLSFTDSSGDFGRNRKNMAYYMAGCTVPGVAMGHKTYEQIMAGTEPPESSGGLAGLLSRIKYAHPVRRTEFFEPDGDMVVLNCAEAYERLEAQMLGPNGLGKGLAKALHERGRGATPDEAYNQLAATFTKFGYDAEDLQTFAGANVMHSVYLSAVMGDSVNRHNQSMLVMVEQAMAQRNMQFAAEESMFVALLRPSVSFFEALFYALAPIIAFLIPMGAMGMRLVGKYLMFTIWVVLYFPLLAIIGAFGDMQFAGAMEALKDVALTPHGSMMVLKEAQDTMGTVSLLAAAVPQLALAILMGGPVAMSALAGRMQGGDMVDEKIASPSAASNGAFVAQGASYTGNPGTGVVQSGAPLQAYSLQGSLSETVSSSKAEQAQSQEQFSSTVSSTLQKLQDEKNSARYEAGGDYKKMVDDAYTRGLAVKEALSRNDTDQANRDASTTSTASGSVGAGAGRGGANFGASAGTSDAQTGRVGEGSVLKKDESTTDNAEKVRKLAESYSSSVSAVVAASGGTALSVSDAEALQQQSADVYSKTEAYNEATAAANTLTSSLSFNDSQIADMVDKGAPILGYKDADAALGAVQNSLPPSAMAYFNNTQAELEKRDDFVGDARAAALWRTVTDGRAHVPMEDRDELSFGAATMAQLIAGKSAAVPTGDAAAAKGVAGNIEQGGTYATVTEANLPGAGATREQIQARVQAVEGQAGQVIDTSTGAVGARQQEVADSPSGLLPRDAEQSGIRVETGGALVGDHIDEKSAIVADTIANRSPGSAVWSDTVSQATGLVQDAGRGFGALVEHGGTPIAETESDRAYAEEVVQSNRERIDRLYAKDSWSEEEKQAFAIQQAVEQSVPITPEQQAFAQENMTGRVFAEASRMDQDPLIRMRDDGSKTTIEGLDPEILDRANNR